MRTTPTAFLCLALAALGACSDPGETGPAPVASESGSSRPGEPARLAGRLLVTGLPAGEARGELQLSLWNATDLGRPGALPLLTRSYELDDPDWTRAGDVCSRYFGLDDAQRVGDPARPLREGLVLEARLGTDAGAAGPGGTWSTTLGVRNGESDLQLVLPTQTATAQPDPRRKQGGG